MRSTLIQYIKFCFVGASGVVVDTTVIWLLISAHPTGWEISFCKLFSAEVAVLNNFFWNDVWTFKAPDPGRETSWLKRVIKFNLISLSGIAFSLGIIHVLVFGFQLNVLVANVSAIVLVSVWNFVMSLKWGWQTSDPGYTGDAPSQ